MSRQLNSPNWFQPVTVYIKGSPKVIEQFDIGQCWDGTLAGHRRLRKACVETVEGLRDRTELDYILWSPIMAPSRTIPLADRQHVIIG